eukprot:135585-Prorocentrum_minimum.AAC.1
MQAAQPLDALIKRLTCRRRSASAARLASALHCASASASCTLRPARTSKVRGEGIFPRRGP